MSGLQTNVRHDKIYFERGRQERKQTGGTIMESILCVDIPVQMISCTDTNGKITPMRFRFRDRNDEIITINIDKIISTDQQCSSLGANFVCAASLYGSQKTFQLRYNYYAHEWRMSGIRG
jgi:hypothetical protein